MKESASFISSLTEEIKQDNIKTALEKVESAGETEFGLKSATKCLIEVQLVLCKGLSGDRNVTSVTKDVFLLAKRCLDVIEHSQWEIGNSRLLTCVYYLVKYFLSKDELSLAQDVLASLQRWNSHNSTELSESERSILTQNICHTLSYHLTTLDLNKLVKTAGNSFQLVFDCCRIPIALQSANETVLKKALIVIRSLLYKIHVAKNIEMVDSIHLDCVESIVKSYVTPGESNVEVSDTTFLAFLEVLDACVIHAANLKSCEEFTKIVKVIEVAQEVSLPKDCNLCLELCRDLMKLVLIDLGAMKGHFAKTSCHSYKLLEKLSSTNTDLLMLFGVEFLVKVFRCFSWQFKKDESVYSNLPALMVVVCKIQKATIALSGANTEKLLGKLNVAVNLIVSKVISLPKELINSDDFLEFIFEFLVKAEDYNLVLLEYDHNNAFTLKDHCSSLVERILFLIHNYYSANMFEKAFQLAFSFIEKLVCLSCDSACHLSSKSATFVYKVVSLCCRKIGQVEAFTDAVLASICKQWFQKSSTIDVMFDYLTELKNFEQYDYKCSSFFELIEKRRNVLTEKWKVSAAVVSDIRCKAAVLCELKSYRKLLQNSHGDLLLKVFKSLLALDPSVLEAAQGLVLVLDLSTRVHVDVAKFDKDSLRIQENLRKQVKGSSDFDSLLLLGSLIHYSTVFKMYAIRKKIQVKTVRWKSQEAPQTLNETGMFSDPHETLGPIATSELTFSNQQALLDQLHTSYGYFRAAFQKSEDNCNDLDTYLDILYSNLKLIAQLYTLHYFQENAIEAWKLLHSYGEKFSHQNTRITAVTNLLKLQAQFDNSWTDDALEIAASLAESSTERQLFYIRLANNCMKSSKTAEAVEHLEKVGTKFWDNKVRTNYLLTVGEVLLIPESLALWKGIPSSASSAVTKASRHLFYMIKSDDWDGFMDHCILEETFLDTLMWLKRYSSSMMMPRLTYYYLTEQSTVVQKLAVPLRLAELLISLAFVDVSVHKKDDCDMKLANVIAILGLHRKRHLIGGADRKAKQRVQNNVLCSASAQLSPSSYELMELMATAPAQNSSPLQLRSEEWTQIVLHSADCVCLSCSTPKCLQLTFDVLLLQAASHCIRRQFSQAIKFYDDALVYLEVVSNKGKASADWLEGRQAVLYYFYTEMLIGHGNWRAAESFVRKIGQLRVGIRRPGEVFGVSADLIMLQRDNLIFANFRSRMKKPVVEKPGIKNRLTVNLQSTVDDHTPSKTCLPPPHLLVSEAANNAAASLPEYERRSLLVSAKTLEFSSSDEEDDDVVNCTVIDNDYASPILARHKARKKLLPAFVAQVPKTKALQHVATTKSVRQKVGDLSAMGTKAEQKSRNVVSATSDGERKVEESVGNKLSTKGQVSATSDVEGKVEESVGNKLSTKLQVSKVSQMGPPRTKAPLRVKRAVRAARK